MIPQISPPETAPMWKPALFALVLALTACNKDCPPVDTAPAEDPDADGDGTSSRDDCDDTNPDIHPGAVERCDGVDNDCDGVIDEEDAADPQIWYQDRDDDGFGDPNRTVSACAVPAGYLTNATDCDDLAPTVYPGAPETCNGIDDDCDAAVDEDATNPSTWYADADGDRFGDPDTSTESCAAPEGYVADATDCDDTQASVSPAQPDLCDGVDTNCDGLTDDTGCESP